MNTYPKIDTIFKRDVEGTKKLIENSFRDPAVEYLKDSIWEFTEKIDGTNIRIMWDGHKVTFGGRTDRAQIPAPLMNQLNEMFGGNTNEELFEQTFGEKEVILFGEGYGPGIQKGGAYRKDVSFILFDVKIGEMWLERKDVEDIAKTFGIDVVPVVFYGPISAAVEYVKKKPTTLIPGGTAQMEGVVGRNPAGLLNRKGERIIVKIKVCDFT